jgi:tetratricopeptide (TPR) repeat protein
MVRIPENVRRVCFILFVVVLSYATTAQPSRPSFLVKADSIAQHNPADAIEYLLFHINNGYQNKWEEAQTLQTMVGLYGRMSLTDQATMYYLEAAGLFHSLEMLNEEAVCYSNMGFLKLNLSQYKEDVEFYHKSAAIYEFEIDDKAGLSHSWANIGNIYFILEDYDRALQYASKSNELAAAVAQTAVENYTFKLLGMVYRKQGRYTKAEELNGVSSLFSWLIQ